MKRILIALMATMVPAAAEESKDSMKVIEVSVPMLCGEYKDLRKVLDDGKYLDLSIGNDQITKGTLLTISYSNTSNMIVIGQWAEDMTYGCLAYTAADIRFVKDIAGVLKPKSNL